MATLAPQLTSTEQDIEAEPTAKCKTHSEHSRRVYCIDMIRGICILGMTLVHSYQQSFNIGVIFGQYPFLCILLLIVGPFTQFRGLFVYVSGMIAIYRLATITLRQILSMPNSVSVQGRSRTYWNAFSPTVIQLLSTALAWPLLCVIDSIWLAGYFFREEMTYGPSEKFFPDGVKHLGSDPESAPVSFIMMMNAIFAPIIVLLLFLADAIARRFPFRKSRQRGRKTSAFTFVVYDRAAMIVAITGVAFLLISITVALTRWPFDQSVARTIKRVYQHLGVPNADKMCDPSDELSCSMCRNNIFKPVDLPYLYKSGFNSNRYFFAVFATELTGNFMGIFPFTINYLAGAFMGLLLALFKRSSSKVEDDVPRTQLDCHEMACVLWVWNALYMAVLAIVFLIWLAVYPYNPFGTYRPYAYNGPYLVGMIGPLLSDKEFVAEELSWHTGAYELELTVLETLCATLIVYWCEFTKFARRICRKDGEYHGAGPFVFYRRKKHVPCRFLRRFSTYSVSVFYVHDYYINGIIMRIAFLFIEQCKERVCDGPGVFYPILVMPVVVVAFLYLIDCTFGYLSVDFFVTLIMKTCILFITAIAFPLMNIDKIRNEPRAFSRQYIQILKQFIIRIFEKPPYLQHTAVEVERFFPLELDDDNDKNEHEMN